MPADRTSPSRATRSARAPRNKSSEPSKPCEVCGKEMTRANDLPRHMLIHDPSKQIPCDFPLCDYRSFQKYNLETHMLRHVGDKRYKCKDDPAMCSFETCDRSSLHRHRMRWHGYVPKKTAPKKSKTQGEGSLKRRNPHRVPVRVLRTVNNEFDSSRAIRSQFLSFRSGSGSGSTSSASVSSAASTPDGTLSDLSGPSDLTDSEVGSDSGHSKTSIAPAIASSASALSSLSPVDEPSFSPYSMLSPQHWFPQKAKASDNCMDILSPLASEYLLGAGIPQDWTGWSKIQGSEVMLEPLQTQYPYTVTRQPAYQPYPFEQPCQMNFNPVANSSQESSDYSTPFEEFTRDAETMLQSGYRTDIPDPSYSPSQSLSPLTFPDTFQAGQMVQSGIPSFDNVLDNTSVAAVCKEEEFDAWPLDFNSGGIDLTYHADQMSQFRITAPDYTSNALDTPGVALKVNLFDYNQQKSLELGPDLERFNNWYLEAYPNGSPSFWDGQFPAVTEYRL